MNKFKIGDVLYFNRGNGEVIRGVVYDIRTFQYELEECFNLTTGLDEETNWVVYEGDLYTTAEEAENE